MAFPAASALYTHSIWTFHSQNMKTTPPQKWDIYSSYVYTIILETDKKQFVLMILVPFHTISE